MQLLNQFLDFLQQGIAAIFRFIELVWAWSVVQIGHLTSVPWSDWPMWKQIAFVVIAAAVAFAVLRAILVLWAAGASILSAFVTLLMAFVSTLPSIALAGAVALGGLWILNNVEGSNVRLPTLSWNQTVQ